MPVAINPIRKARVKKSLLEGKSIRQALADAGYAPGTQRAKNNSTTNPVVKVCFAEIAGDIKKQITVESVLANLCYIQQKALLADDHSTATRCEELKGKWLSMFTDRQELVPVEREENAFSVSRLAKLTGLPTN